MKKLIVLLSLLFMSTPLFAQTNTLTWDFPVVDESRTTTFNAERKTGTCAAVGTFAEIGTVLKTLRSYSDTGLAEGSTYCYQVRAVGPGGPSAYSNQVARTIPFTAPPAPSNLRVVGGP